MTRSPDRPGLTFDDVEGAAAALRKAGCRVSAARRLVLEALFAADGPVSAEDIADGLGGRLTPLDLASTYRNLETLGAVGLVHHIHLGHAAGLYALASGGQREYLACERCGELRTVDAAQLEGVRAEVRRHFGYEARFGHFPIMGRCATCAAPTLHEEGGHEAPHVHEHSHGDQVHTHPHTSHDHRHTEHAHEHSHGDLVHAHPHAHELGLENTHEHAHA